MKPICFSKEIFVTAWETVLLNYTQQSLFCTLRNWVQIRPIAITHKKAGSTKSSFSEGGIKIMGIKVAPISLPMLVPCIILYYTVYYTQVMQQQTPIRYVTIHAPAPCVSGSVMECVQ